jgi:hypothetical protein
VVREDAGTEMFVTGRRCRTAGVGLFAATDECLLSTYYKLFTIIGSKHQHSLSTRRPRARKYLSGCLFYLE